MAYLSVLSGPRKGQIIELEEAGNEIGRNNESISFPDTRISHRHAHIFYQNGRWLIEDLGSTNSTFLRGMEISRPMPIFSGNRIRCGHTILEFYEGEIQRPDINVEDDEIDYLLNSTILSTVPSNEDSVILSAKDIGPGFLAERLRIIYELISEAGTIFSTDKLLQVIIEKILEVVKADHCFAMMIEKDGKISIKASKEQYAALNKDIPVSRTILKEVINKQVGVLVADADHDNRFSESDSIYKFGIRSTICVPIKGRERTFGAIQITCNVSEHTYSEEELQLLTAIGFQAGIALDNLRLYESLMQTERMTAMGETIAFLSHHIKNILQAFTSSIDIVDLSIQKGDLDKIEEIWPFVQRTLEQINQLILNMLTFSKEREPLFRHVNINNIIDECVELEKPWADERNITLMKSLSHIPLIQAEAEGLQQAFLNLITNALEVVPNQSGIVTISSKFDDSANNIVLQVSDNGKGIEPEQLKKIFTPFFSNKGQRGTGLGLAVAQKVVKEHNGEINVFSKLNQGTKFTITLPANTGDVYGSDLSSSVHLSQTDLNKTLKLSSKNGYLEAR